MRLWLLLLGLAALPAAAEDVWILQTGPEAVDSVPLDPVQPVSAWRGLYSDGEEKVWLFATDSPNFFPPANLARTIAGTRWAVTVFYPATWTAAQRTIWFDRWAADFRALASLPDPGWPIVFPAVLKKG